MAQKYRNFVSETIALSILPDMNSMKQLYNALSDKAKYEWIDLACVAAKKYDGYTVHYDCAVFEILVDGTTEWHEFTDRDAALELFAGHASLSTPDEALELLMIDFVKTRAKYYLDWDKDWRE